MKAWNWFLAHGDKILAGATTVVTGLTATGVITAPISALALAAMTWIHNTLLPEPSPSQGIINTPGAKVQLHWITVAIAAILAVTMLTSCASVQAKLDSPAGAAAITAGVQIAVTTAEQHGVSAAQINSVAKAILVDVQGQSLPLAALTQALDAELVKLKVPQGDIQAFQGLEIAFDVWLQAKYGASPTIAQVQQDLSSWLNLAITDTGGV